MKEPWRDFASISALEIEGRQIMNAADGKDLDAEIDLVGPGEACERWSKTPEYQEWFKETGQTKESAVSNRPIDS